MVVITGLYTVEIVQQRQAQHMDRSRRMNLVRRSEPFEIAVEFACDGRIEDLDHLVLCAAIARLPALQKTQPLGEGVVFYFGHGRFPVLMDART